MSKEIYLEYRYSEIQNKLVNRSLKIAIIGLGYVGLPLAIAFSKKFQVIGFDTKADRIEQLNAQYDSNLEVLTEDIEAHQNLLFSSAEQAISDCDVFIVTVPTPIDSFKQPDLQPLVSASNHIAKYLRTGNVVIYESTVYPGATEEVCIPALEKGSALKYNLEFFAGYSPERINPGDKSKHVTQIKKVTSGSTPEIAQFVDQLYASIIVAGTHLAPTMQVAEAAKVIENTQRDVNIALMNEFALIFNKLGINTEDVLKAAETKWNFLPFRPGLVGGHCISVDPYYLTHKAQSIGLHPEIILAARRLNDRMGEYVATQVIKHMVKKQIQVVGANILVMGLSFKENCPDIRNTKIIDLIESLKDYDLNLDIYDPWVNPQEVEKEYGLLPIQELQDHHYDAIIIALKHEQFIKMGFENIRLLAKEKYVLYDLKQMFSKEFSDLQL